MASKFRQKKPSVAIILSVVALVFALTGAAVALPGKGSVDKNDIKKNAVKSKQIKNGQVKGVDIAAGVIPAVPNVPQTAYGKVTRDAGGVTVDPAAVGINSAIAGPLGGMICYDLAFAPSTGQATPVNEGIANQPRIAELAIPSSCAAPHNDAVTITREENLDSNDEFGVTNIPVFVHFTK